MVKVRLKHKTSEIKERLRLARLYYEKCELIEAKHANVEALKLARSAGEASFEMEALGGLLRVAAEALDEEAIRSLELQLDERMSRHPDCIPRLAWYCKGAVSARLQRPLGAQKFYHRYLKLATQAGDVEGYARGWTAIASSFVARGNLRLAEFLARKLLSKYEQSAFRSVNGTLYLTLGVIFERKGDFAASLEWLQKAHVAFLAERNWYYHLHVLYGYARLARKRQNYAEAYWNLELIAKVASSPEFAAFRSNVADERKKLEADAVDLLIDNSKGLISVRETGTVSLGKQYVLLHILDALYTAHEGDNPGRGLSKAELIRKVWREEYRPEAHDNKLYYNINRLRKLLEPDMSHPKYLLNSREGYRLAPGLKIQWLGTRFDYSKTGGINERDVEGERSSY